MLEFKPGEKVRIIDMPSHGSHLIGEIVTVALKGGFSSAPDDVMVMTARHGMILVKAHQLARSEGI